MNYPLLWASVKKGLFFIGGLLLVLAIVIGSVGGLLYLGVPMFPAIALVGIGVIGVLVGATHYLDNA